MSSVQRTLKRCTNLSGLTRCQKAQLLSPKQLCPAKVRNLGATSFPDVKEMPGPRPALPLIGTQWIYKPFGKFVEDDHIHTLVPQEMFKKYGPVYSEKRGGHWLAHVFNAEDILQVFSVSDRTPFRPGNQVGVYFRKKNPDRYNGPSIADSQGEEWKTIRGKFNSNMLHPDLSRSYMELCLGGANDFVKLLKKHRDPQSGLVKDFGSFVDRLAMECIWNTFFEESCGILDPGSNPDIETILANSIDFFNSFKFLMQVKSKLYMNLSPKCRRSMRKELQNRQLLEKYFNKIKENLLVEKTPAVRGLVRKLIAGNRADDKDIMMILGDSIVSGTITTSTFACMFLHKLLQHPRVLNKLCAEIDRMYPDDDEVLTWERTAQMVYLRATMKEANRCTSIIPNLVKMLKEDIVLKGYRIPAMTPIVLEVRHSNLREEYFRRTDELVPERWLRGKNIDAEYADFVPEAHRHARLVAPFGFGARQCLGRRIAENTIHLMVVKLLKAFHMSNYEDQLELHDSFVLSPKNRVAFYLHDRK